MVPDFEIHSTHEFPPEAQFIGLTYDDFDEEGYGFFRGVWPPPQLNIDELGRTLRIEATLIALVDGVASTPESFDEACSWVETYDPDETNDHEALRENRQAHGLAGKMIDDAEYLHGLEIGVAGLSLALTSVGCLSVASCRSHAARSWAAIPVVVFSGLNSRRDLLTAAARSAGCGFSVDPDRPELIAVESPNVVAANSMGHYLAVNSV